MAADSDPYRTLGLTRDATLDDVRRAYRRLAKANHPDAAGEAALPRFLAIQAAYDTIAGPDARARRPGAVRPTGPRRAWDAERDRTDATYRAYGGRSRRRPTGPPSGPGRGPAGERPPADRPAGPRPSGARPSGARPTRPARPPNKATLGSTSYDGAEGEPFEPDWGGASWYGTTSGTYWTLNPKEYADPRKHGPEYQARARRNLDGAGEAEEPDPVVSSDPAQASAAETPSEHADARPPASGQTADETSRSEAPPATHTTSSWWEATAGHPPRPDASAPGRARPGDRRPGTPPTSKGAAPRPADRTRPDGGTAPAAGSTTDVRSSPAHRPDTAPGVSPDALLATVRTWLDDTNPGTVGRVGRALVGWAPLALGIGWLGGEISGCGRFAAGCDATVATSAWIAQIAALLVLILVGRLARIASVATLATLAAAIPAALLLSATGSPDDAAAGRIALSGLLIIAWVVGLGFGVVRGFRESRGSSGRHPVPPK